MKQRSGYPLLFTKVGDTVEIVCCGCCRALDRHLNGMGVKPGVKVEVLQNNGTGLIIMLGNSRVGIDGKCARRIIVCPSLAA